MIRPDSRLTPNSSDKNVIQRLLGKRWRRNPINPQAPGYPRVYYIASVSIV